MRGSNGEEAFGVKGGERWGPIPSGKRPLQVKRMSISLKLYKSKFLKNYLTKQLYCFLVISIIVLSFFKLIDIFITY